MYMGKCFNFAGNFCVRRGRARGHGRRVDGDVRGRLLDQGRLHDAQARGHRHVPGRQRAHLRQTDPRTGINQYNVKLQKDDPFQARFKPLHFRWRLSVSSALTAAHSGEHRRVSTFIRRTSIQSEDRVTMNCEVQALICDISSVRKNFGCSSHRLNQLHFLLLFMSA